MNLFVFHAVAAAQVITRLQLTWYGTPAANVAQVSVAFQVLVMILVTVWAIRAFLFLIYAYLDPNTDAKIPFYIEPPSSYFFFTALDDLMFYMYVAFVVVVLRNIRSHIRARYSIPEPDSLCCRSPGCEDVCCSLICPCFTVAQMMRHTADYQVHHGVCCSTTGLVKDARAIV
jgi:Cys-rich protein (TIGR01571 family)